MKMKTTLICCLSGALFWSFGASAVQAHDQIPAPPQKQPIALVGGTVHTVSGDVITSGTVVFDNGKISSVGTSVNIPDDALVVDVTGKHIYPALIEPVSRLGLAEINSVRATVDYIETGDINPNVRSETAVNPDSERIPVTRSNGIAVAGAVPSGGLISGQAALIMLDGWTWEDMTLKAPAGMVIGWPGMSVTAAYGSSKESEDRRKEIDRRIDELETAIRDAKAYHAAKSAAGKKGVPFHKSDVRWEALIPVLEGKVPVWIEANSLRQIEASVEWADRHGLKMVLVGGADAPRAADLLRRKNIPVIITPILRLPERRYSDYDEPFTVPKRLSDAGVRFCIAGDSGSGNERNLPYHAAMAAAYGLPKDEALKSVTLYAAEILGAAGRIGSLEKGKDATLIVTDGDPLEIMTNVEKLYIQGRDVDLENRQTMLYRKYTEKYRRIGGTRQ